MNTADFSGQSGCDSIHGSIHDPELIGSILPRALSGVLTGRTVQPDPEPSDAPPENDR